MIFIKTIGIIIRDFSENKKKFIGTRKDLFKKLYKYDVNIIGIPITMRIDKIKNIVAKVDGVILSGGDDFIDNDFLLVEYLYENNIPTLGICLGMQTMALYFGNGKEIDVIGHHSNNEYVHDVDIVDNTLLKKIIGSKKILVNSRHHYGVDKTNLKINAFNNGLIEGVEDSSKKFFMGVLWHPESLNDLNSKKIFDYFINSL